MKKLLEYAIPVAIFGGASYLILRKLGIIGKTRSEKELEQTISDLPSPKNLPKPLGYYALWADRFFNRFAQWKPNFIDRFSKPEYEELETLSPAELMQIVKDFGVRDKTIFGGTITQLSSGNLIDFIKDELSGWELTRMLNIFKKTGLV